MLNTVLTSTQQRVAFWKYSLDVRRPLSILLKAAILRNKITTVPPKAKLLAPTALSKRLIGLAKKPLVMIVHQGNYFWQFEASSSFPYFIGPPALPSNIERPELNPIALKNDVSWHASDAIDWIDDNRLTDQREVHYSSVYVPTYNWTMTMVTVDEDVEDDDAWDDPHF